MPTIKQLPLASQVAAADEVPLSQNGVTRSAKIGQVLAGTQPAITLASGALLGRVSTLAGGPEPVAVGAGLTVAGGMVAATGADHLALPVTSALLPGDEVVVNSAGAPRRMAAVVLRRLFSAGAGVQIDAAGVISAPSGGGGGGGQQGERGPQGERGLQGEPGPVGPAGPAGSATTDASALPVRATGAPTARTLAARAADGVNVRDYGATLDGVTDDTAGVTAARAAAGSRAVTIPAGIARVAAVVRGLVGRFDGDGQIQTSDGHRRAPRFSRRTTAPTRYGNQGDIDQAFDGDLSSVHLAIEHRIEGEDTLTKPASGYVMHHENSAVSLSLLNESGWNQAINNQSGGRTGVAAISGNIGNVGQGDTKFMHVGGFVSGTKPGSSHFLANPAVVGLSGELFGLADGTHQEVDEFSHDDAGFGGVGFDVAVSSTVRTFVRSNDAGAKGAWWLAFRLQSSGSKPVDVALQPVGRWRNVIDTTAVTTSESKAVWTLAAGQRIYLNATAEPSGFSNPAQVSVGTSYTHFNPATSAYEIVVGGNPGLVVGATGVSLTGVPTAPTAAVGTNTAQIATMAAVKVAFDGAASKDAPAFTGLSTFTNSSSLAATSANSPQVGARRFGHVHQALSITNDQVTFDASMVGRQTSLGRATDFVVGGGGANGQRVAGLDAVTAYLPFAANWDGFVNAHWAYAAATTPPVTGTPGGARGVLVAGNAQVRLAPNAVGWKVISGHETDVEANETVPYRIGHNIVSLISAPGLPVFQGSILDAAIVPGCAPGAAPWRNVIALDNTSNGGVPALSTDGVIIKTSGSGTIRGVVDTLSYTVTGPLLRSRGITVGADPANGDLSLGELGGTGVPYLALLGVSGTRLVGAAADRVDVLAQNGAARLATFKLAGATASFEVPGLVRSQTLSITNGATITNATLDGTPIAPTAPVGTDTAQIATMAAVKAAIDALVVGAPGALDTLNEIAAQLANDESAVAALTATVGTKLSTASNLADVSSVATARTNLGLGNVAVLDVGTAVGTVAAGNDGRITAAQTAGQVSSAIAAGTAANVSGVVAVANGGTGANNAAAARAALGAASALQVVSLTGGTAFRPGGFYTLPVTTSSVVVAATKTYFTPFVVPSTASAVSLSITYASGAASTASLGIYNDSGGIPGTRQGSTTVTIPATTGATGTGTFGTPVALSPGLYWLASQFTAGSTVTGQANAATNPGRAMVGSSSALLAITGTSACWQSTDMGGLPITPAGITRLEGTIPPQIAVGF